MSWSDWGYNLLTTSIANVGEVISEVNDSYVQPTLDVVNEGAVKILTDFAEAIDVPEDELDTGKGEEQNNQNPSESTSTTTSTTSTSTSTKASYVSTKQQQTTTPTVQAYNSPLISIIQSGADYVGEVLQHGVDALQSAEAQSVYQPIVGFGMNVANESMNALETVGASAMSVLTTEVGPSDKPKTVPFFLASTESQKANEVQEECAFSTEFAIREGPEALERLGNTSIESQLKYQSFVQKFSSSDDFEITDAILDSVQEMVDIFEMEKEDETEVKFEPPTFLEDTPKYIAHMTPLQSLFSEKYSCDESTASLEALPKALAFQNECSKKMGGICALIVNQYCLLGELLLEQKTIPDIKVVAAFIKQTSEYFEQNIQFLANEFLDLIRQIDPTLPNYEEIKTKIYFVMGKSISNMQNARLALLPLCKYLLVKKSENEMEKV